MMDKALQKLATYNRADGDMGRWPWLEAAVKSLTYAPINVMSHYPPPGHHRGKVGI